MNHPFPSPGSSSRRAAAALAAALILSACGYHHHDYFPPVTVPVPNSVAIADVNGDGAPDLVVATTADQGFAANPGFANVILNTQAMPGTFQRGVGYATSGANPSSIAVADLTGAGALDLVVANFGSGSVSVFMHGATPGSFQAAVDVPVGGAPNQVVIADVDGDGTPDLVLADFRSGGGVIVLLQDGAHPGTFLAPTELSTGNETPGVAVADVNGDGIPDLIAATYDTSGNHGAVYVFMQSASQRGTFAAPVIFPAGAQPQAVKVADLNGDGKPDLVVANSGPGTDGTGSAGVSVLLQDAAHPGSFLAAVTYATAGVSLDVAVADLDGDGKPDLVVANLAPAPTGSVSVLLQDPAHPGVFLAASSYAGFGQPLSVAIGDLNGDGHPDIAVADGPSATVLIQNANAPGTFAAAVVVGR